MNNNLEVFKNEEFGEIRGIEIDGKSWLVGKDVTVALGYQNPSKALTDHVDEEDKLNNVSLSSLGQRGGWLINESGLYSLILSSKLPSAKKFKRWVTSDVLPSIRKHGMYAIDELLDNPDLLIATATKLKEERIARIKAENKVKEQQKVIEHKEDVIIGLVDEVTLAEKRQVLNRVVRYKGANFQERWRELYRQFEMKYHVDVSKRLESYNFSHKPKLKNKVDYIDKIMNKIPELYEIACKLYENDVKELTQQMYSLN